MSKKENKVTFNPDRQRFELNLGHETAELVIKIKDRFIYYLHTWVPEEYENQGFAKLLAEAGLKYALEKNLSPVIICPYVKMYVKRNPNWREELANKESAKIALTSDDWPKLDFKEYGPTMATIHQWIQIIGKIRLKTMPWQNHSWHTALYITSSGYSTQSIPYEGRHFQIDLDFIRHQMIITCSNSSSRSMDLGEMSVADFYANTFKMLAELGVLVKIHTKPNEMDPAIDFRENTDLAPYDKYAARSLWKAFMKSNEVFSDFRSEFVGKNSPVHLFWGAFDLAVTRFSGKKAPSHQGEMPNMPKDVMQEAYSQEVSSAGFWPGSTEFQKAIFYAYAYPSHEDYGKQSIQPEKAYYNTDLGEFMLEYEDVRTASNPEQYLMKFLRSTYESAAELAGWDRNSLERDVQRK